jgi:hypothetical protein
MNIRIYNVSTTAKVTPIKVPSNPEAVMSEIASYI